MKKKVMNMFKGIKYKIQITEFLFITIILITSFSSCARERLYLISNSGEHELISRLLTKNCYSSDRNEYKYTEKQLFALENDLKCVLEISVCNFQNYINKSNHNYYVIKIDNNEITAEERDDFRYVWKPEDFDAIQEGKYKGYIKQPYLNVPFEIDSYTRILSFYKSLCIYLKAIDNKYFPDYYRYEYMFEFYLSKI